jgi:ABC-type transport system involved in multi-copper enzyme maturation permease subunit
MMTNREVTGAQWARGVVSLSRWLTGPIFDKEMRVSSRRRRNYVLRFVYIGLFTFLVAVLWLARIAPSAVPGSPFGYQASRMAYVGQVIITAVLWFQFLASQAIALVMLSTSISDEITKRTLGTLMTTPIRSFQIVVGKLTSKLLQIVLLLAISLPLLAVVRVFGGVPWNYLLCGLCVTLTMVIFVGSLSLFFSIFIRRAYAAIIAAIGTLGGLFWLVPVFAEVLCSTRTASARAELVFLHLNPYGVMMLATISLYTPSVPLRVAWPLHCAIMLGASLLLLLLAVVFVRRAALRQVVGRTEAGGRKAENRGRRRALSSVFGRPSSVIRRVVGPPVLWKEWRIPLLGRRRPVLIVAAILCLVLLALTYWVCVEDYRLRDPGTHLTCTVASLGIGLLFTMVLPATCITTERESQTWALLLTTTLGRWEILWSKFLGTMRRCVPAWLLLFVHLLVFVTLGILHPVALVQFGILAAWLILFLTGTGLYFSTRLRHTTTAVIANMALAASLWALLPLGLGILPNLAKANDRVLRVCMDLNPLIQAGVITRAVVMKTAGPDHGLVTYHWWQTGMSSPLQATGWIALTFAAYLLLGLVFLALAAARLRRNPF